MPRHSAHTTDDLLKRAMNVFWAKGYSATSMNDLVEQTGISRHGIYGPFSGKPALFAACLEVYQSEVVTPAFEAVEAEDANLADIAAYFETQISLAEAMGLPGPGCLVANTMTELAPHVDDVHSAVLAHNDRLECGFLNALTNALPRVQMSKRAELARLLMISAQGLWSYSRHVSDAAPLRAYTANLLEMIEERWV